MTTDLPQAAIGAAASALSNPPSLGGHGLGSAAAARYARTVIAAVTPHLVAAVAAERERIALALLGCLDCGRIHTPHPATFRHKGEPLEHQSWAAPDGHAYRPPHLTRQQIAAAISPPQETRND